MKVIQFFLQSFSQSVSVLFLERQRQANKSRRNVINKGDVGFLANSVSRILSLFLDKENLARDPNQKS